MKKCCKTCKFNRERNLKQKTCLKGYTAIFGYCCKDWKGTKTQGGQHKIDYVI